MTDEEAGRVRDFVGYGRHPPDPNWPGGAHVAVNFVINFEEGGERSVPDGDPAVCVTGICMEDTHSYANSLQWGPVGWPYGAHVSTVTARIQSPAADAPGSAEVTASQPGLCRYHP